MIKRRKPKTTSKSRKARAGIHSAGGKYSSDAGVSDARADSSGNGIRAMIVGLSVLQAIARERRPLPLRDIATASGLTPSRVHRYLSSLVSAGFVEQQQESGYYSLGQSLIELGLLALGQLEPIRVGIDALVEFSDRFGCDGHLSVWGTFGPTVMRWQSGRLGHQFKIDEGRVLPLLWSATGRVMMAYRDFDEIDPLVMQEVAAWNHNHPERKISRAEIINLCKAVRQHGLSSSVPSQNMDALLQPVFPRIYRLALETTAVPIFDHLGRVRMALTFFGTDSTSSINQDRAVEEQLRATADAASRRLGASS